MLFIIPKDGREGICKALNKEDLINDERFSTPSGRVSNAQVRKKLPEKKF